ncbi:MAG: hypothetical protein HY777_16260 [Betaproteobacteria bacterium]|nr:hypothetical protein [Betaproteobacteria bacterium]
MLKSNLIAGLLALLLFAHAQYQGWNLFDREASAQTSRVSGGNARNTHK